MPHHLKEEIDLDVLRAGKDLLDEKPCGIDLAAARRVRDEAKKLGRFVRVSSEFPFLPGVQRAWQMAASGSLGRVLGLGTDGETQWALRGRRFCLTLMGR